MARRSPIRRPDAAPRPARAAAAKPVTAAEVVAAPKAAAKKIVAKIDPTTKKSGPARKPAIEDLVRRARGSLAMALLHRFLDAEVMAQGAALAFYALLSLAPLLLILLWMTASSPAVTESLLQQIADFVGAESGQVARTIVENAIARPDTTSIAGWWSLLLLFIGATAVFAQLQESLNKIFRTDATKLISLGAWLRKRVFSFGLVFALAFLLLVSMTVNTALQLAFSALPWMLPVIALLWIYYAALVVFLGAMVTAVRDERAKARASAKA